MSVQLTNIQKAVALGALVAVVCAVGITKSRYKVGVNLTDSLPNWGYVVDTENQHPARGEYVQFYLKPNRFHATTSPFVKRVVGVPGDEVRLVGRQVIVAGVDVGRAKERSRDGKAVQPTAQGVLPRGRYFVVGDHVDSFDSRYADVGWIPIERIRGVARPVL